MLERKIAGVSTFCTIRGKLQVCSILGRVTPYYIGPKGRSYPRLSVFGAALEPGLARPPNREVDSRSAEILLSSEQVGTFLVRYVFCPFFVQAPRLV